MNELEILCGSLGRPSLPLLKWAPDPIIFVEPQEFDLYTSQHLGRVRIVKHPRSGMGFSGMMNQLVNYTLETGRRYFCFTDDDVYGMKYRATCEDRFARIQGDEVRKRLHEALEKMKQLRAAQMSISFAAVSWSVKVQTQGPVGAWGVYLCDAQAVKTLGGFDETLWIFSDWEMSARLIQAGYPCLRTNLLTFEHKMKGMDGGAADLYKDQKRVHDACEQIRRRYPAACRIDWVEEHGQHEIRFNWRALAPGSKTRSK